MSRSLLGLSLAIDLVGNGSFLLGESSDVVWAPCSAVLVGILFGSAPLGLLNFFKEALPLLDVIPLATFAWLLVYVYPESTAAKALGLQRMESSVDEYDDPFGSGS